ncbi:hypothetical protein [Pyrobaculum ferrireducens]|uniref:Uncharacterized protein n=1 Tax=Pyrobaculum ferrireducens TaxID=1104324 RepID=G7VBS1_9CREN|nr:hypothetical protein [Pyrobaculum ferrireducens]AET33688.1 hypothetical protein P186_2296 [Pyrobaculum ferrireducens]
MIIKIRVGVFNPAAPERVVEVEGVVDTGAIYAPFHSPGVPGGTGPRIVLADFQGGAARRVGAAPSARAYWARLRLPVPSREAGRAPACPCA